MAEAHELRKARSLLVLLLATCQQTLLALDAASNTLDSDLADTLRTMIERTDAEIEVLNEKLSKSAQDG